MTQSTLAVEVDSQVCRIKFNRPEANNAINETMLKELDAVFRELEVSASVSVIVLAGSDGTFCSGIDFAELAPSLGTDQAPNADAMFDIWERMRRSSCLVISHVNGHATAGGIGFVAASDLVIASESARFTLSELLFGLIPACVMPFLIARVGWHRAHYMACTTLPVSAHDARSWGLVDEIGQDSLAVLKRHLPRLRRLPKRAIANHKSYMLELNPDLLASRSLAVNRNREVFQDQKNVAGIQRFVRTGAFPWETRGRE